MNKPSGYWIRHSNVWHADCDNNSWSALCGWVYGREYFIKLPDENWVGGGFIKDRADYEPPSHKCKECARLLTAHRVAKAMRQ